MLGITTILYVLIAAIAVTAVPIERLTASAAPLSLVFRELTGVSPATIAAIAVVATLNTIIAELTLATRVVYGMAKLGDLPAALGAVSRATATVLIVAMVLALFCRRRWSGSRKQPRSPRCSCSRWSIWRC